MCDFSIRPLHVKWAIVNHHTSIEMLVKYPAPVRPDTISFELLDSPSSNTIATVGSHFKLSCTSLLGKPFTWKEELWKPISCFDVQCLIDPTQESIIIRFKIQEEWPSLLKNPRNTQHYVSVNWSALDHLGDSDSEENEDDNDSSSTYDADEEGNEDEEDDEEEDNEEDVKIV